MDHKKENFHEWFTPGRFVVLLALFIFVFFPDVVLGTRTFIFRDYGLFGYPLAFYHRESFWRGEVPLWNPLNDCGVPFLAQWNTLVLYPGSLFYLLLPLSWSLGVFCLAHLLLAGLGMYLLAYRWTGNRLGASVAGLGFVFNGFTLSCLMWPHCMASLAWMPFVVLTVERAWRQGGRFVTGAAVTGALQMLAGPPEFVLVTWLMVSCLWFGHCAFGKLPAFGSLRRFGLIVLTITGLTAVLLLPFLELLGHSQRTASYGSSEWSMPPTGWANLFVPLFHCFKTPAGPYMQYDQGMISSYYTGIGMLALAVFAVFRVRNWRVRLLGAIAVVSMILALGDAGYLYAWIKRFFSQIGFMRFPIKFVFPAIFSIPLLAAFAVREMLHAGRGKIRENARRLFSIGFVFLLFITIALRIAQRNPGEQPPWTVIKENGLTRGAFLLVILGAFYALTKGVTNRTRWLLGIGSIVLLWLDVVTHAPSQNPTVERAVYEPGLQPIKELKPQPKLGDSRAMISFSATWQYHFTLLSDPYNTYLNDRLGLFSDSNLLDGVPKVDGFFSLYPQEEFEARTALYISTNVLPKNYLNEKFLTGEMFHISTNNFAANLADFVGVCQITAPGKRPFDWEARSTYLPLVTAGQKPVFLDAAGSLQGLLDPAFDPRRVVYLPLQARTLVTITNQTSVRILSQTCSAHRVVFETEAKQPSMVVAAQTFYPCWRAYVDDQPVRLWRANHAYQALQIPAGRHKVELVYRDGRFLAGMGLSGITMLGCLAALMPGAGKRQRTREPDSSTTLESVDQFLPP